MRTSAGLPEAKACDGALVRAFGFLGKRWNGMLIATLGNGPSGFVELRRSLGISDSVLSDRLSELTRTGLVERAVVDGPPLSVTYALSQVGRDLLPALEALGGWARTNLSDDGCARQHPR